MLKQTDTLIGELTRMGHRLKQVRMKKLDELGLYQGQPRLLFTLNHEDGISQRELADRIRITPATLTRMLQRMEKNGFLVRKADQGDQRVTRVFLTKKSQGVLSQLEELNRELEEAIFEDFSSDDREQFSAYLKLITERFDKISPCRGHHKKKGGSPCP